MRAGRFFPSGGLRTIGLTIGTSGLTIGLLVSSTSGPKPAQPHLVSAALGSSGLGPWLDDAPLTNATAPAEADGDRTRPTAPPRAVPSGPISQRLEGLLRTVAPSAVTVSASDYPDLHAAMVILDADGSTYTIASQQLHEKVHLSTFGPVSLNWPHRDGLMWPHLRHARVLL